MKIFDISQEVFSCDVYPGDPSPERIELSRIRNGCNFNLTGISMCAHNGTHIDAPFHFYDNGKTVDRTDLNAYIGRCFVSFAEGALTADAAGEIIENAKKADPESAKRILIGGSMYVTLDAAKVFSQERVLLLGNESQSVGPVDAPAAVHYELLASDVALLEGIRLAGIPGGVYWLNAAPLNLGGSDGSPCRAVLISD